MKHRSRIALVMAAALLAGCGGGARDDDRTATGQILEGSASDEMLPLDRLTSQPPLARDRGEAADAAAAAIADPTAEAEADEGPGDNPLYAADGTPL